MARRVVQLVAAVTAVAALSACGGDDDGTDVSGAGEPASAEDFALSPAFDVERIVVDGVELEVRGTGNPEVLRVTPQGLRLITGCHDVFAEYSLDLEGDLTISDQRGPQVGCAEEDLAQADHLTAVVSNGARWTFSGDDLVATKAEVEVIFTPTD